MPAESNEKKELFERIESLIIEILNENLQVPDGHIISGIKLDFSKKKLNLPQVSLNNIDFTVEEMSVGSETGIKKEETSDTFVGDGKTYEFKLSKESDSLINIKLKGRGENKWKTIKAVDDKEHFDNFKIDYKKGLITFRTIPKKGPISK